MATPKGQQVVPEHHVPVKREEGPATPGQGGREEKKPKKKTRARNKPTKRTTAPKNAIPEDNLPNEDPDFVRRSLGQFSRSQQTRQEGE